MASSLDKIICSMILLFCCGGRLGNLQLFPSLRLFPPLVGCSPTNIGNRLQNKGKYSKQQSNKSKITMA